MALASGTRFGAYEITGELGVGGMGEVYRATDTNLKRNVAIKILPQAFAADADRIARFQREAEALAALNHSNIAQIYGLERNGESTALAMELIEGPTLADRIAEGPIPVDEALGIAAQIADALEAAHEQNIVHRDLKPANVKLRPDGTVKVLDFGIATAPEGRAAASGGRSPTLLTPALTEAGVLLGTAAYMSPEQARGRAVDQRADIWAFGCVLYEMLTGQPAFGGEDVTTTLARVIEREADTAALPATVPAAVRHTIELCLEKEASERIADIRDVRLALAGRFETASGPASAQALTPRPAWRRVPAAAFGLLAGLVIMGLVALALRPETDRSLTRFSVDLVGELGQADPVALSPDGRRIVYSSNGQLYSQRLDQEEPTAIPGTEQALSPFFSPDGESVAFFTPTELKTVGFDGQLPRVIARVDASPGLAGTWDRAGRIVFGQNGSFGLSSVPAAGGEPEPFAELADYADVDFADVLPGGEWVVFTGNPANNRWSNADIVAQNIATGERKILLRGGTFARYVPTGHLVFARGGTLYAANFDVNRVEVTGPAVPVVQGVRTIDSAGVAQYAVASNGTLIYAAGSGVGLEGPSAIVRVDRDGNSSPLSATSRDYDDPRVSPDGTRVAVEVNEADARAQIWLMDLATGEATQLTFEGDDNRYPVWSPDGQTIFYTSRRGDTFSIYRKAADGTGEAAHLFDGTAQLIATDVLPGNVLVFQDQGEGNDHDILTFDLDGGGPAIPFLATRADERSARVSPDGAWIAYLSGVDNNQNRIYVRPYPSTGGGQRAVSQVLSAAPVWSRSGNEIYFIGPPPDGPLMSASITSTPSTINPGTPQTLFGLFASLKVGNFLAMAPYDAMPNGDGIIGVRQPGLDEPENAQAAASRPTIKVVLNWFEELKTLVPTQ